jgi:hypothetical protein
MREVGEFNENLELADKKADRRLSGALVAGAVCRIRTCAPGTNSARPVAAERTFN